jgi:hypothetical protein
MKITVTNTAPDFSTPFTPPTGLTIPLLGTISFPIPGIIDAEGGSLMINPFDTPPAGLTALTATWDSANNKINVQSTSWNELGTTTTPLYK